MTSVFRRAVDPVARPMRPLLDPAVGALGRLLRRPAPTAAGWSKSTVRPCAEPYAGGDGPVGVLLVHGFCGSPFSMRPWAEHLERAGFRVVLPRLPGHGTVWQELNATEWTDWYDAVERELTELQRSCTQVFLAGLSMGGALCLRLAQQHGAMISGLALVNPCVNITDPRIRVLPVLQRLQPSLAGITNDIAKPSADECGYDRNPLKALYSQTFLWADVRRNLDRVEQPLLVYQSRTDHVVDPSSTELIKNGVRSTDLTFLTLERSYHVATLDYEAEEIFDGSVEFFRRLVKD